MSWHPLDSTMPLPTAAPERQLKHRRSIDVQIYSRGDGLWEVDARISDVRTRETHMVTGLRAAGSPIHDMLVRLVVDEQFNVVEAGAETTAMPYPGECGAYGDAYAALVGLNLMRGFRHAVKERLGGVRGCTHITELVQVLPTAVVQAFADEVIDPGRQCRQPATLPDRPLPCAALERPDGEDVLPALVPPTQRRARCSRFPN